MHPCCSSVSCWANRVIPDHTDCAWLYTSSSEDSGTGVLPYGPRSEHETIGKNVLAKPVRRGFRAPSVSMRVRPSIRASERGILNCSRSFFLDLVM